MIEGSYQGLDVEIRPPGIAVITFAHPERLNALSFGQKRDLVELLGLAQLDDRVRIIVLTATGRGFAAGVNNGDDNEQPTTVSSRPPISTEPINRYGRLVGYAQDPIRAIRRLDKITVAAVNGYAIQLGLSIVLACDFAVAARSAQLGSATLRMGWQPDEGGHWLLVEHIGAKRTLDFLLHNRIVDAGEALELGLISEVVNDEALMDRTLELADELARLPQVAARLLKKAVYNAERLTLEQAGDDIATKTAISDFHSDAADGAAAFREKRIAVFNRWLEPDVDG